MPSFGALGLGGVVAFVIGSVMLIDTDVPGFGIPLPLIGGLAAAERRAPGRRRAASPCRARRRPVVSGRRGADRAPGHGRLRFDGDGLGARARRDRGACAAAQPLASGTAACGSRGRRRPDLAGRARTRRARSVSHDFRSDLGSRCASLVLPLTRRPRLRDPARVRARRRVHARPLTGGQGPGPDRPDPARPADGEGGPARRSCWTCRRQDVISRDNVSVKVNAVVYFRVDRSGEGDHPGRELLRGHQPARADHAALGAGPARARRDAVRARQAQRRHPAHPRRADRRLGHQGRQRRDQARRPRRDHDPRDRPAGRGRARRAAPR